MDLYRLDVLDPVGMKARLEQKSMQNFLKVIRTSLEKSGYSEEDIDYLAILHMKKSAHDFVLHELGLHEDNQFIYMNMDILDKWIKFFRWNLRKKKGN